MTEITAVRSYSIYQLQECAEREVKMRRRVYPNRVLTHRMTQAFADSEIEKMQAIAAVLCEIAEKERLI